MRVFLDITIGDASEHARQLELYARGVAFLRAIGPQVRHATQATTASTPKYPTVCFQLGLSGPLEELEEEAKQLLLETYDADPSWSSKGPMTVLKPTDIKAGRIVIELYDQTVCVRQSVAWHCAAACHDRVRRLLPVFAALRAMTG
jgi:hypothetical protein